MTSKKSDRASIAVIRGTEEDKQRIAQLVKQAGLSQQDYLLKVALLGLPLEGSSASQTPDSFLLSTIASQQKTIASQQEVIEQLSKQLSKYQDDIKLRALPTEGFGDPDIKFQVGVCEKGRKASAILAAATRIDQHSRTMPKDHPKFALAYDLLWRVEKSSNGNYPITTAEAEVPKELQGILDDHEPLSKLLDAMPCYKQFAELEGWEMLPDKQRKSVARHCYKFWNNNRVIDILVADTQEAIAKLQAGIDGEPDNSRVSTSSADIQVDTDPSLELTAAIAKPCPSSTHTQEPLVSTATPTDSEQETTPLPEPTAPSDVPESLSRKAFMVKYGLAFKTTYSLAVAKQRSKGYWTAPDGKHWRIASGEGYLARWVTHTPE